MDPSIIDSIASGEAAADIAQGIKDTLFAKASQRVDDFRQFASNNLFGYLGSEEEESVEEAPPEEETVAELETEE